jgi:oligopeptide transport system substrate-binding protein
MANQMLILDPGRVGTGDEAELASSLFAGLVEYDRETNVLPHVARSWEVLDGGQRYLFHLRQDARWTDGSPVTAQDFEWAWKRNLAPGAPEYPASLLDDVLGARAYRLGLNPDLRSVGVRALDEATLEVRLESPAPYFIYLMANPVAFPLPAQVVERYGEDWWKPPLGVYNGAFRLSEATSNSYRFARNPDYFGDFRGNLDGFVAEIFSYDTPAVVQRFLEKDLHVCTANLAMEKTPVPEKLQVLEQGLVTSALMFNPGLPPMQDVRVRKALAHGLDFKPINDLLLQGREAHRAGGAVPMGLAGYSPELGLPYDLPLSRNLLAEAGFPGGAGFPVLKFGLFARPPGTDEMARQLETNLGIHCEIVPHAFPLERADWNNLHLTVINWVADYPDPDSYLRQSHLVTYPQESGWSHPGFEQLVDEARKSTDRPRRLALYREADRILVEEQAIIIPINHSVGVGTYLVQPWVRGFEQNALGQVLIKHMRLEREG